MINEKKRIFGTGNKDKLKETQRRLNRAVRKEKLRYKKKVEKYFTDNNMAQVWRGLRLMSGYTRGDNKSWQLPEVSTSYADEVNTFYNQFDSLDFSNGIYYLRTQLTYNPEPFLVISEDKVRYQFAKINPSKAAGPDMLSPRVLRTCSGKLAGIFTHIFNLSFSTLAIPEIWKQSCIIPVPKSSTVSCMDDLRPVALTSVVMKICERFVLTSLRKVIAI
ncbi:RNA-directed DNA polymerase from mobile element jockey [Holothuria leucospilota]|uniref:RNA-directed DNA polymerase from mobile element jockey n=1 Tax=Holothuria leucospilota TaxID=206669 RepID=A0A9Q0YR65_HOLLE|nr:RNA-directed DNA polymerase from mobile element jockey [Holothuria leucospilota]